MKFIAIWILNVLMKFIAIWILNVLADTTSRMEKQKWCGQNSVLQSFKKFQTRTCAGRQSNLSGLNTKGTRDTEYPAESPTTGPRTTHMHPQGERGSAVNFSPPPLPPRAPTPSQFTTCIAQHRPPTYARFSPQKSNKCVTRELLSGPFVLTPPPPAASPKSVADTAYGNCGLWTISCLYGYACQSCTREPMPASRALANASAITAHVLPSHFFV